MKRLILLFFTLLLGYTAAAQGPSVTITNNTGYTFRYLYVSSNNSSNWEEDVLGRKVLESGNSFKVTLPENGVYDFKGVDTDDDDYYKWNIMIRGNTSVSFTMSDYDSDNASSSSSSSSSTTRSSSSSGNTSVTVVNDTGYTIYYLYISRDDTSDWEEDVLGDDVLRSGENVRVTLPGPGVWDFKAIDKDDDDYYKMGQSISRGSNRVVFRLSDMD